MHRRRHTYTHTHTRTFTQPHIQASTFAQTHTQPNVHIQTIHKFTRTHTNKLPWLVMRFTNSPGSHRTLLVIPDLASINLDWWECGGWILHKPLQTWQQHPSLNATLHTLLCLSINTTFFYGKNDFSHLLFLSLLVIQRTFLPWGLEGTSGAPHPGLAPKTHKLAGLQKIHQWE